ATSASSAGGRRSSSGAGSTSPHGSSRTSSAAFPGWRAWPWSACPTTASSRRCAARDWPPTNCRSASNWSTPSRQRQPARSRSSGWSRRSAPAAPPLVAEPLTGRVAVVTGASRGIGAAVARRLAGQGADVVLAARSAAALDGLAAEITAAGGSALVLPVDLADATSIAAFTEAVGGARSPLDILVNNAGVLPPARRLERIERAEWERTLAVNLTAPWELSCWAKGLMTAGGVIVNVASPASFYPSVGLGPYNASKAALAMLTRSCALEWARDGVRVVAVVPGKVDTELVRPILDYVAAGKAPLTPQGRVGSPDEVAELVAYLVSDRAGYITGSFFPIDGGELASLPQ